MLVRADAIPVVEMMKAAEAVDVEAAALWLHMGLWDSLGEMIDDARPEIDAVWKSVVAAKSDRARGLLVRQAIERRVDGEAIDDIVKAAAGLSLVRGYVAKDETPEERREASANQPRDHGRFSRTKQETAAYDALAGLTTKNPGMESRAKDVATELQGDRYKQMRVVGNALVATGHPKAVAAGGVVRVAAEVGPSAEDVLGTHLRRAAYRYRGTEKRPDRQLVRETKEAQAYVAGLHATATTDTERRYQANLAGQLEERKPGEWGKGSVAYRMAEAQSPGQHLSEDQIEMRTTGDIATAHLMRQLPSKDEALLSQEAGRTPPSVGVLIDRDGDVVSEAMGFQGDHYVPFDLKNLKRLHGGSYVRTRALGGPTSEDIYTGLLTGARQMTVVSRSGVFTVEFDPDLRGGRRYSDKARQMVDRYSRLLDVVEGGQDRAGKPIYTQDVDDDVKRKLKQTALESAGYDEDEAELLYQRALKKERVKAGIGYTEEDLDTQVNSQLNSWVRNRTEAGHAPGKPEIGRAREQIRAEVRDSARQQRQQSSVQQLRLNAEGYFRAMQSLRREFPYYIRDVSYESLPDFEESRRTRQRDEAPLGFGAPGAAAANTHVRRRDLVPATQSQVYGIKSRRSEEGGETADATASGKPKPSGGSGEAAATFADLLKDERFQDQVANQARVLEIAELVPALPKPADGAMDRDYSKQALESDADFVKWLTSPGNTITGGDTTKIAKFITEEATPQELRRLSNGLSQIAASYQLPPTIGKERVEKFRGMVEGIARARQPFADTGGPVVLHSPDQSEPRPYPFPPVVAASSATDERFNRDRHRDEAEAGVTTADREWAETNEDKKIAAQLRLEVQSFKAAQRWGEDRAKAKKGDVDPVDFPTKPAGVDDTIDGAEAEDLFRDPESSVQYKTIARRQRAWAWAYTERLRKELRGGGAAPKAKAIEGEVSARLVTSSRRKAVWHSPDDPLSKALAKRLRSGR